MPEPVDLAVVVTPARTVPGVIGECVEAGVKGAIIISAGFKETGPEGAELESQVLEHARRGHMRLIGPNCLGVMRPGIGLNATFATQIARPGTVGFLSQSGALCTAILDWSLQVNVGFSAFISIGSMLDVGWGDLIDYLGDDPDTKCIVIYMESIGDARSFLSASREVALTKPIIVIKAGRTEAAAKAAASHTGSLAGSDEVLDAAFRRVGVLRVNSISQVFDMAEVLAKQPRPRGPKLAIVTNAGGPGVLATDALIENRGELAELSSTTHRGAQRVPAGCLEPQQSTRHPGRRRRPAVRQDPGGDGPGPQHRRTPGDPDSPGHERPDGNRPGALPVRQGRRQAGARQLDGGRGSRSRRADPRQGGHSRPSLIPIPPRRFSPTCGDPTTTSRPCTRPRTSCPPAR